jgi:hypothetical protein
MDKVMANFNDNGCHTRAEIREFIENANGKKKSKKNAALGATQAGGEAAVEESKETDLVTAVKNADRARPASVSAMVFTDPNPALVNRECNAAIIAAAADAVQRGESEISAEMARRILFPQCNPSHGGSGSRETLKVTGTQAQVVFDDRTFFQLKTKPEYLSIGKLYFRASNTDRALR